MSSWLMIAVSAALMSAVFAAWDYEKRNYYKHKTVNKCYQCAYSPGKTVYKEEKYPVDVPAYDKHHKKITKRIYKTRQVPVSKPGGWDKCLGPFDHYQAKDYGIDEWDCHDNCYTRVDSYGNIFRGCYKDEWGVDSSKLGCHWQAGSLYCFCKGNKCNNKAAPDYIGKKIHKETYQPKREETYGSPRRSNRYY